MKKGTIASTGHKSTKLNRTGRKEGTVFQLFFPVLFSAVTLLASSPAFAGNCSAKTISSGASLNPISEVTLALLILEVDKNCTLDEMARMLDPQSWSRCSPKTVTDSTLVEPSHPDVPLQTPPAPGTSWEGLLREKFTSSWRIPHLGKGPGYFSTQNLVGFKVTKMDTPNALGEYYRADYKLQKGLPSVFLGVPYRSALNIYEGVVSVTRTATGQWQVYGLRYARFDLVSSLTGRHRELLSGVANRFAPGMITELFQTVVGGGFSCGLLEVPH